MPPPKTKFNWICPNCKAKNALDSDVKDCMLLDCYKCNTPYALYFDVIVEWDKCDDKTT